MDKLDRLGWVASRSFRIGEQEFGIRTTSQAFAEWLDYALGSYRIDPLAEEDDFSLLVADESTRTRKGFHILYRGTTPLIRSFNLVTFGRAFVADVQRFILADRRDAAYLDAMPVEIGGSIALLPSMLAPPFARFGHRLAREEVRLGIATHVALDPDSGLAWTNESLLDIPADAYRRLSEMEAREAEVDRFSFVDHRRLDAVFILDGAGQSEVTEISRASAVHRLAANTINLRAAPRTVLEALEQLTRDSPCYGLAIGDARTTLHAVVAAVDNGARTQLVKN